MTNEELQRIKDQYKEYKAISEEINHLRDELETRVDTYSNLCELEYRLEELEEEYFGLDTDEGIYRLFESSTEFDKLQCGTDKKLYFFHGIVKKDDTQNDEYRVGDDHVIYVPRYSNFSPFVKYYVILLDLVHGYSHVLIPLEEYKEFRKDNYVFDLGKETDISYGDDYSYNIIRHRCDENESGSYYEEYARLRIELFKNYVHSETEEEAVKKLVRDNKLIIQ